MENASYLVSVTMLTYNHEKYIRQALDSILMQEVNFDYEIIVSDDASTDKTQEIIREYQEKNPGKIKAVLRDKNVGATRNSYGVKMMVKSKYIAVLDGDDFWIGKDKLQKQVDLLESNPDIIGCTCKFLKVDEDGQPFKTRYASNRHYDKRFTMKDFLKGKMNRLFNSSSVVYRNIYRNSDRDFTVFYMAHSLIGDGTTISILLDLGDFYIFSGQMAAYRMRRAADAGNAVTIMAKNPMDYTRSHLEYAKKLQAYFENKYDFKFMREIALDFSLKNYKKLSVEDQSELKRIIKALPFSEKISCFMRFTKVKLLHYIKYLPKKILRW